MSAFSWLNPFTMLSYVAGTISKALSSTPLAPQPPPAPCLELPSLLVLGAPDPEGKDAIARAVAATYGMRYVSAWETRARLLRDIGEGLDAGTALPADALPAAVEAAIRANPVCPGGFLLDAFPLPVEVLLDLLRRLSGTPLMVLHFDTPEPPPPQPQSPPSQRVPDEIRASRYTLEMAARHYEAYGLLRCYRAELGPEAVLGEVHRHLGEAGVCCQDDELVDLVAQLPNEPLTCLRTIAKNLAESREERFRRLNIQSDRFQHFVGRFDAARRILERLGFVWDTPEPGIATVGTECPSYVAFTISTLCVQRVEALEEEEARRNPPSRPSGGGCLFAGFASPGAPCPITGLGGQRDPEPPPTPAPAAKPTTPAPVLDGEGLFQV